MIILLLLLTHVLARLVETSLEPEGKQVVKVFALTARRRPLVIISRAPGLLIEDGRCRSLRRSGIGRALISMKSLVSFPRAGENVSHPHNINGTATPAPWLLKVFKDQVRGCLRF